MAELTEEEFQEWRKKYGRPADASTPMTQVEAQTKGEAPEPSQWQGRLANAVGMGVSGGQIGGMVGGPVGMALGAAGGAGFGALMQPSESPMTDVGALAGSVAGGMVPGGSLARMLGGTMGAFGGAVVGSIGDKQAGNITETPWGKIGIYTGATAVSLGMGEAVKALSQPGPAYTASQQLRATLPGMEADALANSLTPIDTMRDGFIRNVGKFGSGGSSSLRVTARTQSDAGQRAIEKVVGKVFGQDGADAVERGLATQKTAQGAAEKFNLANAREEIILPKGYGTSTLKTSTKTVQPTEADFAKHAGLSSDEADAFFSAIRKKPEHFIDSFLPTADGTTAAKGLLGLNAMMKVLPEQDQGNLGSALVARVLDRAGAIATNERGSFLSGEAFEKALFSDFGKGRLTIALGKPRTDALELLAKIMKTTDPIGKDISQATGMNRPLSYLSNRMVLTMSSASAAGVAGSGGDPIQVMQGAVAGAGAAVAITASFFTVVSRIMTNPQTSYALLGLAEHGNGQAVAAFARTLMSPLTQEQKKAVEPVSTPATRFGFFNKR